MRVVITEDIIRNALNESIDEFIINEGFGDAVKGAWGYAKKAGNWLKNAAAAYMDKKTHGQWNKKYGIHVQGDNMQVGHYYLKKWFERHYNRLYDIIWGDYYGNKLYFYTQTNGRKYNFDHDWKNNMYVLTYRYGGGVNITYKLQLNNDNIPSLLKVEDNRGYEDRSEGTNIIPKENSYEFNFENSVYNLTIFVGEDNSTPEVYIAKNCTPNAFVQYSKNGLGNGKFKQAAVAYLEDIQQKNSNGEINENNALNFFTMEAFYGWWGKNAGKGGSKERQSEPKQQTKANDNINPANPDWSQYQAPPEYSQNYQNGQYQSPFGNDAGHGAPGAATQQRPTGKKDPNRSSGIPNLKSGGTF